MTTTTPLRCKCRRQAETSLRCARCSVPICPDCSVVVAVGMICRDCARGGPNKLHQVSAGSFALATAACLGASLLGGWILVSYVLSFGYMSLWAGFLFGLAIGEIALRITGRKRGLKLELLVGISVAAGIAGGVAIEALIHPELDIVTRHLTHPLDYVLLALAIVAAVGRIRNI